ncbi:MAG: ferrous iron transport protein B [Helicobacteraceae bacterium]|jgi:ferrous iron transport protein B|nr:ferrous iron transport protein B [Helicobacteraceae bacterium]
MATKRGCRDNDAVNTANHDGAIKVALVGQPNVGKSSVLNAISGSKARVGNFPGVTVEKTVASLRRGNTIVEVTDLPGTYSLKTYSQEEKITGEFLENGDYDVILQVVESANLERNLTFTAELLRLNRPMIIALNMIDEARKDGIEIDEKQLSVILGAPCVKVSATKKEGLQTLIDAIAGGDFKTSQKLAFSDATETAIAEVANFLASCGEDERAVFSDRDLRSIALDLIFGEEKTFAAIHDKALFARLQPALNAALEPLYAKYETRDLGAILLMENRAFAKGAAQETSRQNAPKAKTSLTDKADRVLLHPILGLPIFLFLMWALFQATFTLGEPLMGVIEYGFDALSEIVNANVANEAIRGLLSDGIIGGVGSVIVFLPNIMILFLGIALLETTGYMARAAFLLDGFLHRFGLHGKSFIPLISGFGCSVPAFMATRVLKNDRDRLLTLFIINFMSCGARLPVYVLFVGAFFGAAAAGNALFGIYIGGAIVGLVMAKVLRSFFLRGPDEPFVMELPRYRAPSLLLVWQMVWGKAKMYLRKAGTFILAAALLIWFASSYSVYENQIAAETTIVGATAEIASDQRTTVEIASDQGAAEKAEKARLAQLQLENSYLGAAGKIIQPVFAPFDLDWKASVALVTGLAAKEVIVSTLGVLYSIDMDTSEESETLQQALAAAFALPSAVAFLAFIMFYNPCLAATVVFKNEAGGVKYAALLFVFTTIVAYAAALVAFGVTSLLV